IENPESKIVLIQPGAKDPYKKQWETARFAGVAAHLANRYPSATVALIGGPEERGVCEEVARTSPSIVDVSGRTSVREVLGLLAEADLLIANDTAMVHAAVALGTITVTVQGPQTTAKWSYGLPHRVVSGPAAAGPADRHANRRALDAVQSSEVIAAAEA